MILILKPMGRHGIEREWEVGETFLNSHEEHASYSFKHSPGDSRRLSFNQRVLGRLQGAYDSKRLRTTGSEINRACDLEPSSGKAS